MAYWLLKTEPSCYSYDDLERDKKTVWDGITNNLALKYLREMRKGDTAIIYHTGDEKRLVGLAEVSSDPFVDPKLNDPKLAVIELKPKKKLTRSLTLAEIKGNKKLQDFILVKMSRLSVMPVSGDQWKELVG